MVPRNLVVYAGTVGKQVIIRTDAQIQKSTNQKLIQPRRNSANAAAECKSNSESDGAWMAMDLDNDQKGFSATFSGGKCAIHGPSGEQVGEILKSSTGLYKVEHERGGEVNPAEKILTLDMLHCHLGHISLKSAQKLVKNNFVTGLKLEPTSDADIFCESCIYAKATQKSVPKTREGENMTEFGGEIYSNVWGPALVETEGGKHYYITYTDDKTQLTNLYLMAKKSEAFEST